MGVRHARDVDGATLRADVCVIGGGIAGLLAATRIARNRGLRVVVLESGEQQNDPAMWIVDRLVNERENYFGQSRCRGPGGTSVRWSGKLLPLAPSDHAERDYIGLSGWPIDAAQLAAYDAEVEALMGLDAASFEEDAGRVLDRDGLLPRGDPDFTVRWAKRPSTAGHDISKVLKQEIAGPNVDLVLGATVAGFAFEGRRLREVRTTSFSGVSLTVAADNFLICGGTLESTRLLLLADRDAGGPIAASTDALGRHLNDHLGVDVATLRARDWARAGRMLGDRWPLGTYRHPQFELTPQVQAREKIASAFFDIGVTASGGSSIAHLREARAALRKRRIGAAAAHAASSIGDLPALVQTARWHYLHKHKYWHPSFTAAIRVWIEQLPHWQNRLFLSDEPDELGMPALKVDYHKTDEDERTFRVAIERLGSYWERWLGAECELVWSDALQAGRIVDQSIELAHPAGTTRMGTNPAESVVDPDLRVHALANLRVVSASVFPSSGSANPVMTIMRLALRAADDVAKEAAGARMAASASTSSQRAASFR